MKRLQERGILVGSVESTDPNASKKKLVLLVEWISLPIVVMILFGLALSSEAGGDENWYVFLVVLFGLLPLEVVTMIYVANQFHAHTEPIHIYSDGVDAYSSIINKIRGVDGFIHKSRLVGVELRDMTVNSQGKRDYDRAITLELSDGKRRMIGIRSREVAADMARTMSLMWMLPVEDVPAGHRRR